MFNYTQDNSIFMLNIIAWSNFLIVARYLPQVGMYFFIHKEHKHVIKNIKKDITLLKRNPKNHLNLNYVLFILIIIALPIPYIYDYISIVLTITFFILRGTFKDKYRRNVSVKRYVISKIKELWDRFN